MGKLVFSKNHNASKLIMKIVFAIRIKCMNQLLCFKKARYDVKNFS